MATSAKDLISNPETAFEQAWLSKGIPTIRTVRAQALTPAYNKGAMAERIAMYPHEVSDTFGDNDPLKGANFRNLAKKHLISVRGGDVEAAVTKDELVEGQKVGGSVIDAGITEDATPLVFDPDVLGLLKQNAPFAFDRLTRRGQAGHQVVFNSVRDREAPAGYGTEGDTANLQDLNKDFDLVNVRVDLAKYMDAAAVTDFSAEASAHYMDIAELAVGARLAEYAQLHEITVLYGDPGVAADADLDDGETGGPGDPNAFTGLANLYPEESKTGVGADYLEDIKAEIRELLQGDFAVNPNDLEIWCSWTMFNELEDELTNIGGRFYIDVDAQRDLDFGNYGINVGGVQVYPGHNIDTHTFSDNTTTPEDYTVGDEGDVFIVNTATAEYRELLPLTTIPLAQRGASDEIGMVEFGTLIERSADEATAGGMAENTAEFGRYLSEYDLS